jgi:AcrR family transcriptional regulator
MSLAAEQVPSTQSRILDAAYDVFAQHGFEGTSVRAVCKRADVNGAALNYHWKSKEALWLAVCERAVGELRSVLVSHLGPRPIAELIPRLLSALFDTLARDPRPARILTWISLQPQSVDAPGVNEELHHVLPMVMTYFRGLVERGEVADVDIELVIIGVYAQLLAPFVGDLAHRYYFGKGIDDPEHAERVRRAIIGNTMRALGISSEGA